MLVKYKTRPQIMSSEMYSEEITGSINESSQSIRSSNFWQKSLMSKIKALQYISLSLNETQYHKFL